MAPPLKTFIISFLLGFASGCTFPSIYQGEWEGHWEAWFSSGEFTNVTAHNWNKYLCVDIHHYEDEPSANTILLKDPVGLERPYYTIYCYFCLFVRKVNADQLEVYLRDTVCSRVGDPTVSYGCQLQLPSQSHLTTYHRKQAPEGNEAKRGLWWNSFVKQLYWE